MNPIWAALKKSMSCGAAARQLGVSAGPLFGKGNQLESLEPCFEALVANKFKKNRRKAELDGEAMGSGTTRRVKPQKTGNFGTADLAAPKERPKNNHGCPKANKLSEVQITALGL